jgi:hypothetical protein
MIKTLSVLCACTFLLGCATARSQKVAIEDLTLSELETFVNKHADEITASFGAPSRTRPGMHAVYWEYKRGQRLVVFLIRDRGKTVAGVNAGADEKKVYDKWGQKLMKNPQ